MRKGNVRKHASATAVEPHHLRSKEFNEAKAWLSAFPTPSDFFHYFSTKLKQLNKDNDKNLQLIEGYKETTVKVLEMEDKLRVLDKEAAQLQETLQEAQISIFDERENYLKLVAENEQLKLQNDDFRRKFHTALLISGTSEKDVTHFLQRHPKSNQITDEMIKLRDEIRICSGDKTNKYDLLDPATLTKQICILEKQQKDTKLVHEEKLLSLKRSLRLAKDEHAIRVQHLEDRLAASVEKVQDKTSLLHKSLVETLELQKKIMVNEDEWMRERKRLMDLLQSSTYTSTEKCGIPTSFQLETRKNGEIKTQADVVKRLQKNVSRLEAQLMDKENLLVECKMQAMRFEKQMHRFREENEENKKTYDDNTKKLLERNQILHKRIEQAEARRKMDGAGFRADVKNLRALLKKY